MIGRLSAVVLDCPDPVALAAFYAELVGGTVEVDDEEWVDLNREEGQRLSFQRVGEYLAPVWPDPARPQQFHLDIAVQRAEMDDAEKQVLALGGTLLEGDLGGTRNWRVYADPVGHPFCLCGC